MSSNKQPLTAASFVSPAGDHSESDFSKEEEDFFPLYVVRDFRNQKSGNEAKVLYIAISLIICLSRFLEKNNATDYFYIWAIGFLYWTLIEFALAFKGTRKGDLTRGTLFGKELKMWQSAILRGGAEGSAITIFGLSVADMTLERQISGYGMLGVLLQVMYLLATFRLRKPTREVDGVTSRRSLFRPMALIVLSAMSSYTFWYFFTLASDVEKSRMMYTLVFLSIWGYLWHFIAYFGNTRWFEWGAKKPGNLFVQAFGFTFDSVIEIALAYVFFLAVYFHLF